MYFSGSYAALTVLNPSRLLPLGSTPLLLGLSSGSAEYQTNSPVPSLVKAVAIGLVFTSGSR